MNGRNKLIHNLIFVNLVHYNMILSFGDSDIDKKIHQKCLIIITMIKTSSLTDNFDN